MIRELGYYTGMARGVRQLLAAKPEPDPEAVIRSQFGNRESAFLETLRKTVFATESNPYHRLFRAAGCDWEDLAEGVLRDGLESTLETIRKAGVYLSHDEFKGKIPIKRSGLSIECDPDDFANPLVRGALETSSSGSRGGGTRVRRSIRFQIYREAQENFARRAFQIEQSALIGLHGMLPSTAGVRRSILGARRGHPIDRWYVYPGTLRDAAHYRLLTRLLMLEARLLGARVTFPTMLPPNDFTPAACRIAEHRARGVACAVEGGVTRAVRTAAAAAEHGLDIEGTVFFTGGEALTSAKRATIEAVGGKVYPLYMITEFGCVGHLSKPKATSRPTSSCVSVRAPLSRPPTKCASSFSLKSSSSGEAR